MDVKPPAGTHLFEILEANGVKHRWFARKLGVTDSVLSYLKSGRTMWTLELMERASEILRIPTHILFFALDSHSSESCEHSCEGPEAA